MKKNKIIFYIFILAGTSVINVPFLCQWMNKRQQNHMAAQYQKNISEIPEKQRKELFSKAQAYNQKLYQSQSLPKDGFSGGTTPDQEYLSILNMQKDGIMCCLEIPSIEVFIPVYHGMNTKSLEQGAGHLYGSSFPVGGKNTHAVLAAHRGLVSKTLFTDLDQLKNGDVFFVHVLGKTLAYKVDHIQTVTPNQTEALKILSGQDYVTLVTCTPYGINSHRLLVRGIRIPYKSGVQGNAAGFWIWGKRIFLASIIFLILSGTILLLPKEITGGRKQ